MDNQLIMFLRYNSPESVCRRKSPAEVAEICFRCKRYLEESAELITEIARGYAMTAGFARTMFEERQLCTDFITAAQKYANIQTNLHNE